LFQEFFYVRASCGIQEIRAVSVSEVENKRYPWLCGYNLPLVQKLCLSVLLCLWYCLSQLCQSFRVNIDGYFCRRYKDSFSNTLLIFVCQATTISVGPQSPVWNLQSKIIICKRCEVRDYSVNLVFFVKAESFNFFRNDLGILISFAAF